MNNIQMTTATVPMSLKCSHQVFGFKCDDTNVSSNLLHSYSHTWQWIGGVVAFRLIAFPLIGTKLLLTDVLNAS